jgi:hypothetical protein
MVEGEPGCHDDYHDGYDGGCDGTGWLPIAGNEQGCAAVCGTGCTYFQNGWSYRDTDWYEATAAGGPVTVSCEAEFPVLALLHWSASCEAWGYEYASAAPCHPAVVSWPIFPAGGEVWITVMPSVYSGVSESEYVFTVCGLAAGPTPVEETSWGQIKRRYRDSTRK